jgi:hypothetical protein
VPSRLDLPDWRNADAYRPLLQAERSIFAWEWLRRIPAYRAAALRSGVNQAKLPLGILPEQPGAARWGLHLFEDPSLSFVEARPIWRIDRHAFVLSASAKVSRLDPDAFALERLRHFATLARSPEVERLLLSDGCRSIRLDVRGSSLLSGPVRLKYELEGIAAAKAPLLVLQRFLVLATKGNFSRSLHRHDPRARRQILLLRTWDALQDGAGQRAIAAELLSSQAAEKRWRVRSPSLRSQIQRLVQAARSTARGGFWHFLR